MSAKNVLILVNKETTIIKFRLEVVKALVDEGFNVYVSVPDGERIHQISDVGAHVIITPMDKEGTNPIDDLKLVQTYRRLINKTKAHIVLTYTIKPNVYGGMAAASKKVPYIANITGLGKALEHPGKLQKLSIFLYKLGFRKISKVFFQNSANVEFFKKHSIFKGDYDLLPGSGVNLNKFTPSDYPKDDKIEFAFISRIMKEKGIEEYIEAARVIKKKYPNTVFHVGGFGTEEYESRMKDLHEEGSITFHGLLKDVHGLVEHIHCVIHPTFYPEGMANILLESAATCRPIITTDRPGSREVVDAGKNGYLIEAQNSADLVEKIETFIGLSNEERAQMGIAGREKMKREFDRQIVVEKYIEAINKYAKS